MTPRSPSVLPTASERVLTEYARPVVHLRAQFRAGRLGLVFGAGVGRDLGFPDCAELLRRVADGLSAPLAADATDPYRRARLLYEHYSNRECRDVSADDQFTRDDVVRGRWLEQVCDRLYRGAATDPNAVARRSPYLAHFLPLVRALPLAVYFGFDDTLERLLNHDPDRAGAVPERYVSLWRGADQPPPYGGAVYHPDGFLPSRLRDDLPGDAVVLGRADFIDADRDEVLAAYLNERTCLIVGSSLSNPLLRSALEESAARHPGQVHYFVRYVRGADDPPLVRRTDEFEEHFAQFNLVTLFLTGAEIGALAALVGADDGFNAFAAGTTAAQGGRLPLQFVYYLVGASGVGKTTALRHFYSLRPHEEWTAPLPPLMTRDFHKLTADELCQVDDWVDGQWVRKNAALTAAGPGIDVVDRGPLDALAYVADRDLAGRAARALAAARQAGMRVTAGQVIRLYGDDRRVHTQALRAFRSHSLAGTERQQRQLATVYGVPDDDPSALPIDGLSPADIARRVARIIHTGPYRPAPLHDQLARLARS
jgi:hypothetical protein